MLVRRRDCDCLLLAWLAASGGLARHRLSDGSAPSPCPSRSPFAPTTLVLPLLYPQQMSSSLALCPSACTHTQNVFHVYLSFSSFSAPSRSISFVLSNIPPSVSLNHTYNSAIHTQAHLFLSLSAKHFMSHSFSVQHTLAFRYLSFYYISDPLLMLSCSLSLILFVLLSFWSPPRFIIHTLSLSNHLAPSPFIVCTNFRDTHHLMRSP